MNAASTRAGRYVQQPTGYRAFIPNPLPPDPPVAITAEMKVLLSQADRALGRLDGSTQTLPHPDLFVFMFVRKEAVLSSQIEGTQKRGVIEVSEQATETARRILMLRETHRSTITDTFGRAAGNGHRVLEHLYEHPIVSVNEVQERTGTTYTAAADLVRKFVRAGILHEITGQARNRKFMYQSYIDLFRDDREEHGA